MGRSATYRNARLRRVVPGRRPQAEAVFFAVPEAEGYTYVLKKYAAAGNSGTSGLDHRPEESPVMRNRALMMMLGLAIVGMTLTACAPPFVEASNNYHYSDDELADANSTDPYVRAWQAIHTVMVNEFGAERVRRVGIERQWSKLRAESLMHGDQGTLQRVVVEGFVTRDDMGELEPHIEVTHQVQMNDVRPATAPFLGRSDALQRTNKWTDTVRNHDMEARLLNRVNELLYGPNRFSGRYGMDTRPMVQWAPEDD
jgi:hypothetical protein